MVRETQHCDAVTAAGDDEPFAADGHMRVRSAIVGRDFESHREPTISLDGLDAAHDAGFCLGPARAVHEVPHRHEISDSQECPIDTNDRFTNRRIRHITMADRLWKGVVVDTRDGEETTTWCTDQTREERLR